MNEELIKNWNKKVSANDNVYVLGDFCWGYNSKQISELLNKLNGYKYLIYGNHDRLNNHYLSNSWIEICPYKELNINNHKFILFHYPIADFNCMHYKSIHLYGHVHNNPSLIDKLDKDKYYVYNVGVDTNNYEPVSYEEILKKLNIPL